MGSLLFGNKDEMARYEIWLLPRALFVNSFAQPLLICLFTAILDSKENKGIELRKQRKEFYGNGCRQPNLNLQETMRFCSSSLTPPPLRPFALHIPISCLFKSWPVRTIRTSASISACGTARDAICGFFPFEFRFPVTFGRWLTVYIGHSEVFLY